MDEELMEKAEAYADARGCAIGEMLGFGIHGIVVVLKDEADGAPRALKVHSDGAPYRRERECYERLRDCGVSELRGFNIPELFRCDDALRVLEMTIVPPPYVLDFAGAWLDFPPEFSEEVWEDWTRKNEEQFGADWPAAQLVLEELEEMGIHMHDPSPSNIRFR